MNDLALNDTSAVPAMSNDAVSKVAALETLCRTLPQVEIATSHTIHGGIYSRTILIPAGVIITGALIKCATTLVAYGHAHVYIGDGSALIEGYQVLPASANRKQAIHAIEDTYLTMLFPTAAKTIQEAEQEFTDEAELLASRLPTSINHITITED